MISFLLGLSRWWKEIGILLIVAYAYTYHITEVSNAKKQGKQECVAEAIEDVTKRINNAIEAERNSNTNNTGDSLLNNDGFRRDE